MCLEQLIAGNNMNCQKQLIEMQDTVDIHMHIYGCTHLCMTVPHATEQRKCKNILNMSCNYFENGNRFVNNPQKMFRDFMKNKVVDKELAHAKFLVDIINDVQGKGKFKRISISQTLCFVEIIENKQFFNKFSALSSIFMLLRFLYVFVKNIERS